jgi:hypothetical protein
MQSLGALGEQSSAAVMDRMREANPDFAPRVQRSDPRHRLRVLEAARLLADCIEGKVEPIFFQQAMNPTHPVLVEHLRNHYPGIFRNQTVGLRETMSYSDYSALTVDILDRMLYGYYSAAPITNMPLVKKHTLRDFRLVARYSMDGATKPFSRMQNDFPSLIPHGAGEPPTERSMQQSAREVEGSTQRVTYQPQLYQGAMSVNWRALVNDDLGIFQDMVQRLAISGNRTIYQFITALYSSTTGPNSTLYNSTFANQVTTANGASSNNPALSWQGLLDARTVLSKMLDIDGQPITFDGQLYLVVGPALENTALMMSKALHVGLSNTGGSANTQGFPTQWLDVPNWPLDGVSVIVDKYLPLITTSAGVKDTQWYLTYDPSAQNRPSIELGQLAGFETPQLFQKVPNTMRVGGGVDPMLGDFWTMNQDYKGILVLGGTQIDGRSTVASTGQGV